MNQLPDLKPLPVSDQEITLMREVCKEALFKMIEDMLDAGKMDEFLRRILAGMDDTFKLNPTITMVANDLMLIKTLANGRRGGKEVRDAIRRLAKARFEKYGVVD